MGDRFVLGYIGLTSRGKKLAASQMIEYEYTTPQKILRVTATGEVSISDRTLFVQQVVVDHSMPDRCPVLIDVTGISTAPAAADVAKMAALAELLAYRFKCRIAYVVVQSTHVMPYLLASIAVNDAICEIRTFPNATAATAWLVSHGNEGE